jgi:hypothetical protein
MKTVLVIGHIQDFIRVAQRDPFLYNRHQLYHQLDLQIKHIPAKTFSEIGELCKKYASDIVFFLHGLREDPQEVEKIIERIRTNSPNRKLIFIDPFSQASTWYFNLLPYVDKLLKRQCYQNIEDYGKPFIGGSRITDFMAQHWHLDFEKWYVGSKIPQGYEDRDAGMESRHGKAFHA